MGGQVIYGDVLFIINFSMDFLVMFMTGKILYLRTRTLPLSISAAVGGIFSVAALFLPGSVIALLLNIAVSFLLCFIAYGRTGRKLFLKTVILFYALSMLLGGGMTVCYAAVNRLRGGRVEMDLTAARSEMPLWMFALIAALCFILSFISGKIFHNKQAAGEAEVRLRIDGRTGHLHCMVDSGNLLREPIGGTPVIVVQYGKIASILPDEIRRVYESGAPSAGDVPEGDYGLLSRVKLIPARSFSAHTLLVGFSPDSVEVKTGREYRPRAATVALSPSDGAFGDCDGLLPAALLE